MSFRETHILDTVLDAIGETPCIRLNRVPQHYGLECEVVAKCEFLNPGGSLKDRIGLQMVLDAEKSGRIHKGDTLIEATSGNTGVGMAMTAAVLGYKMIITMPQKMSMEKESVLKALGAQVIRTPNVAYDHPDSLISVAKRMQQEDPSTRHVLDQYRNPSNPKAHYATAAEMLRQCDGKIDMVVVTTGTGGSISGIAKRLKEVLPHVIVVGVDPVGSILADPSGPHVNKPYQVEGIGYDFVPDVCDRSMVDEWVKSEDGPSFELARMLQREEGMLVGGSSGAAMFGVIQAAKKLKKGQRCVVVFSDNVRNYLTKFIDDNWMIQKGLMEGKITHPPYDMLESERNALKARVAELEAELAAKK